MYVLPTSLELNGTSFTIRKNGDFRIVLDCFEILNDVELDDRERVYACMIIFFEGFSDINDLAQLGDLTEAQKQVFNFFNCGQPQGIGHKTKTNIIDWKQDEHLIMSAVNKVAGKEVRLEPYIHWWTFMGYYMAIGESPLSTIVGIRNKLVKGKKLEKYEREFQRDNPEYFVWNAKKAQQRENDELLKELWDYGDNIDG